MHFRISAMHSSIIFICAFSGLNAFTPTRTPTFVAKHQQYTTISSPIAAAHKFADTRQKLTRLHEASLLERVATEGLESIREKTIQYPPEASPIEPEAMEDFEKSSISTTTETEKRNEKLLEVAGLGTWIAALSTFLIVNNFVGPWPSQWLSSVPVQYFGLTHALAGMLFGGGIVLTTLIEWLVVNSKNSSVLKFWFSKVPGLDMGVVLPALTASIVSGVGLAVDHYDSLGQSPPHVIGAISTLLAFAIWWATTDLTTQGAANDALQEWIQGDSESKDVPKVLQLRRFSNAVSCMFVAALYLVMVLKPGS